MQAKRLSSLDQLRGYAIWGMILVNILGIFEVTPWLLKHHRWGMSYADTIAPLFVFVVGIGFRMSLMRGLERGESKATYLRMVRRYLIIIFLGLLYGRFDFETDIWDALMDIGCAGMLCLPFIGQSVTVRAIAALFFLAAYQAIFTLSPYGAWTMGHSINGGPFGPLAYSFVMLFGTFCVDLLKLENTRKIFSITFILFIGLSLLGFALRMEWPGMKGLWEFSQYAMTSPYVLFSTGLAFLAFLFFYVLCEKIGVQIPQLSVLGQNPLVIYILQALLVIVVDHFVPGNSPAWKALLTYAVVYSICYGVARFMDWRGIIVKI